MADANTLYILYGTGELERRLPGIRAQSLGGNVSSFDLSNDGVRLRRVGEHQGKG